MRLFAGLIMSLRRIWTVGHERLETHAMHIFANVRSAAVQPYPPPLRCKAQTCFRRPFVFFGSSSVNSLTTGDMFRTLVISRHTSDGRGILVRCCDEFEDPLDHGRYSDWPPPSRIFQHNVPATRIQRWRRHDKSAVYSGTLSCKERGFEDTTTAVLQI